MCFDNDKTSMSWFKRRLLKSSIEEYVDGTLERHFNHLNNDCWLIGPCCSTLHRHEESGFFAFTFAALSWRLTFCCAVVFFVIATTSSSCNSCWRPHR